MKKIIFSILIIIIIIFIILFISFLFYFDINLKELFSPHKEIYLSGDQDHCFKQDGVVYCGTGRLDGYTVYQANYDMDFKTFEKVNYQYFKDKNNVYQYSGVIKGADPKTFEVKQGYARDKNKIYWDIPYDELCILDKKDVDFDSFEVIYPYNPDDCPTCGDQSIYAKDKNHLYLECKKVELPVDVESFELLSRFYYSKDKNNVYYSEREINEESKTVEKIKILNGADAETFKVNNKVSNEAQDKNYVYVGKRIEYYIGEGPAPFTLSYKIKSDKPIVELFISSLNPYGIQMEKALLPVLESLKNKIDFQLKFYNGLVRSEEEINENIRQYCIQKNNKDKLIPYLKCFLKDGNYDGCVNEAGIGEEKLNDCFFEINEKFKILENYKSDSGNIEINKEDIDKYKTASIPLLYLNGEKIDYIRNSYNLLKVICLTFNETPSECNFKLSQETPNSGFGF